MKAVALKEMPFFVVLPSQKKLKFKKGDTIVIEDIEDIPALKFLENIGYVKIENEYNNK